MYNLSESWYEPDYYPEYECHKCDQKDKIVEKAGEYLSAIIKTLYNKDALDLGQLESHLDELCHLLDVKLEQGELQIQRKELPFLNSWMKFNHDHLKQLTQG